MSNEVENKIPRFYLLNEDLTTYRVNGKDVVEIFDQIEEWMKNYRDLRHVNRTVIKLEDGTEAKLCTDFMSIDFKGVENEEPETFESEWFGGVFDGQKRHYSTFAQAQEGHRQYLVEFLKTIQPSA